MEKVKEVSTECVTVLLQETMGLRTREGREMGERGEGREREGEEGKGRMKSRLREAKKRETCRIVDA